MHEDSLLARDVATAVRRLRNEHGLRQDEVALAAGVSVRSVHHIEAAKPTIRLDVLERVLAALGLTLEVVPSQTPPSGTTGPARD